MSLTPLTTHQVPCAAYLVITFPLRARKPIRRTAAWVLLVFSLGGLLFCTANTVYDLVLSGGQSA